MIRVKYKSAARTLNSTARPIAILLFCPHCGEQHIDKAEPDVCQDCGHQRNEHFNAGERCDGFTAWLNPPHKSHRCQFCNYVWRPADVPTNGVAQIETIGKCDKSARPRYFATAADYENTERQMLEYIYLSLKARTDKDNVPYSYELEIQDFIKLHYFLSYK